MKHTIYTPLVLLLSAILFTHCAKEVDFFPDPVDMLEVDRYSGYSTINFSLARTTLNNLPYENLSFKEEKEITFVREEEKIATDYFNAMHQRWGNEIFKKLHQCEKSHFKSSIILLEKYLIPDPVENKPAGTFNNVGLQAFYNHLVDQGNESMMQAVEVSALLYEANIVTLRNQLTSISNNADLRLYYKNLMAATRNHFRITINHLENQGINYEPQILNLDDFNEIIESAWDYDVP